MFKHLRVTLMVALMAIVCSKASAVEVEDFYIDYTVSSWNQYVMGYVPSTSAENGLKFEWPNYEYKPVSSFDEPQDYEIIKVNGEDNYIVPTENGEPIQTWGIQAHLTGNLNLQSGGKYKITAYAKATKNVNFGVPLSWGWGEGQGMSGSLAITTEWSEVSFEYDGVGGSTCWIVGQLYGGDRDAVVYIKWITVTHEDETLDADYLCMKIDNLSTKGNSWDQTIDFEFPAVPAGNYLVTFDVYTDEAVEEDNEFHVLPNGDWNGAWRINGRTEACKWTTWTKYLSIDQSFNKISFFVGCYKGTCIYLDNFSVVAQDATENLISNGNFAKANNRGWSKPGWHSHTFGVAEGPGHYTTARKVINGDWFTFCSNKALKFADSGLTPCKVTAVDGTTLEITPIEGAVAANTGLIMVGIGSIADVLETVETPEAEADNLLKPAFAGSVITAGEGCTRYVFGTQNDKTGFFKVAEGKDITVPADKDVAYLEIPVGPSNAPKFIPVDGTTRIINITPDNVDAPSTGIIYNMQGMRVDRPTKGVYIVDGKKVVY